MIFIHFCLRDIALAAPEIGKDFKSSDVANTNGGGVDKRSNRDLRDGGN
jgi:hypothetical protein